MAFELQPRQNSLLPKRVRLVEVGPRDGLQNEAYVPFEAKVALVNALSQSGLTHIETGAFVSAKWVPQMADSARLFQSIHKNPATRYTALTPNVQGYQAALASGASEVAVFTAASEAFTQKNINCSVLESFERFAPVLAKAKQDGLLVRGYVSCVAGCPYQGHVLPQRVFEVSERLLDAGCYEVSLGDTIGVGTPWQIHTLLETLINRLPKERLAVHFHDTYGQALANIMQALSLGISVIDSSVAGLGGCPYAKGASGNVATEEVLYLLNGLGIETGVNLERIAKAGQQISSALGRVTSSKVGLALQSRDTDNTPSQPR